MTTSTMHRFALSLLLLTLPLVASCEEGVVERVIVSPTFAGEQPGEDGGAPSDGGAGAPDADACTDECEPSPSGAVCGDALQEADEECDDGNLVGGDGCDDRCRSERCGNERIDQGEECDPPRPGECTPACEIVLPNCGDGVVQRDEGERCDDGNERRGDGCHRCRPECGDGVLERDIGEECEPAYVLEGTCDADTCKRLPICGNGKVEPSHGEDCDPSDGLSCVQCKAVAVGGGDAGVDAGTGEECVPLPQPTVQILNGSFDDDASAWTPRTRIVLEHAQEGAAAAGSLRVRFLPAADGTSYEVSGAYQCVSVQPGSEYVLRVAYNVPASTDANVSPMLIVRLHDAADCSGASTPVDQLGLSNARGTWTPYERAVTTLASTQAMLVQLSAVKPRNVEGAVLWDDVSLAPNANGAACGNCVVDEAAGETCDDGNRDSGDGCNASCRIEGCGDGVVDAHEGCDDGARLFGGAADACTAGCAVKGACDRCIESSCTQSIDPCLNLEGDAAAGPGAGTARAALCDALRTCVHETGCSGETAISGQETFGGSGRHLEHCYCGTAGQRCFDGAANGSCRAEVEAALESVDPVRILGRIGGSDAAYPIFAALGDLLACEERSCASSCVREPECGDGVVQDRTLAFAQSFRFRIGTSSQPCDDELTHTGTGCSFEECDDGNSEGGDGCDAQCFVEVCGNNLKQGDEGCDDGNLEPGDGCDENCEPEFVCGDGIVEEPFEECDPAAEGPVCTLAQYEADPSACGCDADCTRKVCGNGVLQEGEQCDPPGPVCSDTCELLEDTCTRCLRQIDYEATGGICFGRAWLEGMSDWPGFERGCLNDEACFDLWSCYRDTLCFSVEVGTYPCYCGSGVAPNQCERADFVPTGVCRSEVLTAFQAQFLTQPFGNAEVLQRLSDSLALSSYPSLYIANDLASCLVPDGGPPGLTTRELLIASGMSAGEAAECVSACFP